MILNGHTSESLDSITTEHKLTLLELWQRGIIGWGATQLHTYRVLASLDSLTKTVVGLVSKRRPAKFPDFKKVLPETKALEREETLDDQGLRMLRNLGMLKDDD